ncbi:MAG: hypothetical protein JXR53_15080 [Bacteroidales bacterium]|nr:hypothetical protein [Bacteroidales bacterium]
MNKIYFSIIAIFIIGSLFIASCNVHGHFFDRRYWTKSSRIKLKKQEFSESTHFKYNGYIITIHDSIGRKIVSSSLQTPDSSFFKKDTIDLDLTNQYLTKQGFVPTFKRCIENKEIKVYSLKTKKFAYKIKRVVSYGNTNGIHSSYLYIIPENKDTILSWRSFIHGCPSF